MRIIGGEYKSRILSEFQGQEVRPTSDRAREALFNIFALKMRGARVLDLFAGSGALGIESLSRGASQAVFNDLAKDSVAIVKKNLNALRIQTGEKAIVYNLDYATCLQTVQGKFHFIFIDPPYRMDYGEKALEIIGSRKLLAENGVAVYERDKAFEGQVDGLEAYETRKYGKAIFTFFRNKEIGQ